MANLGGTDPNSANEPSFSLKDESVENIRPLKVRVIGAGFSGIVAAIRFARLLTGEYHGSSILL